MNAAHEDFWVFGYGSLMWKPGFPYLEKRSARVWGYHRRLSVLSTQYRGSPDKPGLVLGLDRGGSCQGIAFHVAQSHVNETLAYLEEREQVTKVYCPHFIDMRFDDGSHKTGYTFIVRRDHEQYVKLSHEEQAQLVAQGVGKFGSSLEYVANTCEHIEAMGICDVELRRILERAKVLQKTTGEPAT